MKLLNFLKISCVSSIAFRFSVRHRPADDNAFAQICRHSFAQRKCPKVQHTTASVGRYQSHKFGKSGQKCVRCCSVHIAARNENSICLVNVQRFRIVCGFFVINLHISSNGNASAKRRNFTVTAPMRWRCRQRNYTFG